MRPINKPQAGLQITYLDSNGNNVQHTIRANYNHYNDAKAPLAGCIGSFCSYCESKKDLGDVAVEHIAARHNGGAATAWDNFLLSCNVCNSNKGTTIVNYFDYHWPHVNNTFLSFVYDATGRVSVNPNLAGDSLVHATNLYNICKLGRYPRSGQNPSRADFRWRKRFEVWNKAQKDLGKYQGGALSLDDVLEDALFLGCWSVWFTVFAGEDDVRRELIARFPGTEATCFDAANHYEPIERNPGQPDPV